MTAKIGFIDLFIDEWHANNYPAWFRSSPLFDGFELGYAWEEKTKNDGRVLTKWCEDYQMTPAASLEEVVEKSDAVIVLAPSNPEVHERLAQIPLKSGKPVYIDKPFAPDGVTAKRIVDLAAANHTPLMSSSALRFGNGYVAAKKDLFRDQKADFAVTTGGGSNFPEYAIHQLEMIVAALGTGASKVRQTPCGEKLHLEIEYVDGRFAAATYQKDLPFTIALANAGSGIFVTDMNRMFENLLDEILRFFKTGISPIPVEETLEIASILGASVKAMQYNCEWIPVEKA